MDEVFDVDGGDGDLDELTPRTNPFLFGHEAIEQELLERLAANKMPHALILHGPKGIGKSTLAFRLARYLFQQSEDQGGLFGIADDAEDNENTSLNVARETAVFRQVASGGHPDLFTVECAMDEKKGTRKASVDVDQIRKVAPFMRMTSNTLDGWRIVVVDDADTMNINAQNALLKILEEPPKKAILILVTHRSGALIPTIRSRCQSMAVKPLNADDCKKVIGMLDTNHSRDDEELFLGYCEGAPGTFAKIIEEGGEECVQDFLDQLKSYPIFEPKLTHRFAESYGGYGKDKSFMLLQSYLKWMLRTMVKAKIQGTKLPFFMADHVGVKKLYDELPYMGLLSLHDDLDVLMKTAQMKMLDKRSIILQVFQRLKSL
jgi:DNA polymerase-3 subunit delta'